MRNTRQGNKIFTNHTGTLSFSFYLILVIQSEMHHSMKLYNNILKFYVYLDN